MSLFTELTPATLIAMLEAEAGDLRQAKDEEQFVCLSMRMQKTLAAYIADAMMKVREGEELSRDTARQSTNKWLMMALSDHVSRQIATEFPS